MDENISALATFYCFEWRLRDFYISSHNENTANVLSSIVFAASICCRVNLAAKFKIVPSELMFDEVLKPTRCDWA